MARTVIEIYNQIIEAKEADPALSSLTATSRVSIWRAYAYVIALCFWTIEVLFDTHKAETNDIISKMKPHSQRWITERAKDFLFGHPLPPDTDKYDVVGLDETQIEAMKVIKYAACVKAKRPNGRIYLRIKVARDVGADIGPLTTYQLNAFDDYMFRILDAGVDYQVESLPADKIKQRWRIYYDPLILDANGSRLDGQDSEPVRKAIKDFLKSLLFNGTYVPAYHFDDVQKVEGVVIPELVECSATYGNIPYSSVAVKYDPDGGYLRFATDADLTIEYIPQTEIR